MLAPIGTLVVHLCVALVARIADVLVIVSDRAFVVADAAQLVLPWKALQETTFRLC